MGGWCYISPNKMDGFAQAFISFLFSIEATFSMSLFFFISAYLSTASIEKKGNYQYLKGQFVRLGIPLLVVMVLLNPSSLYFIAKYQNNTTSGWANYTFTFIKQTPNTSHLWYIFTLLLFEFSLAVYRKIRKNPITTKASDSLPTHYRISVFVIICALGIFLLRSIYPIGNNFMGLQLGNFAMYTATYSLGILVYKKKWLVTLPKRIAHSWFYGALAHC